MVAYELDPLQDPRWAEFVDRHPNGSVFHTPNWLRALRCTYGYEPFVLSTSPPSAELTQGIVFCRINSRFTGNRIVSLPFSDHCEPLVDREEDLHDILVSLRSVFVERNCKYIEIRPLASEMKAGGFGSAQTFFFHRLDLRAPLDQLLSGFHKSCTQRKIRRAERESLSYESGGSDSLLGKFYNLLVLTRRRQKLPPQPFHWFRNLLVCLGDRARVSIASKDGKPIAGILTLRHKDVLVYKYGCSDPSHNQLGGIHILLWRTIQEAKAEGIRELDLGRSDCNNQGLVTFKDRWGSRRSALTYWRYPPGCSGNVWPGWTVRAAQELLARMPKSCLTILGDVVYKHIG